MEAEVRDYFDSVAPRRPAKPPRSDPSEDAGTEAGAGAHDLPELRKLRDLEAKPQVSAFFFPHFPGRLVSTSCYVPSTCVAVEIDRST